MDGYVFEDYAKKLMPRAVGYAAGLLNYFFRGELQVYPLPVFYNNSVYAYALNINNITQTGETLANGKFSMVVRYTPENGSEMAAMIFLSHPMRLTVESFHMVNQQLINLF